MLDVVVVPEVVVLEVGGEMSTREALNVFFSPAVMVTIFVYSL
ncbi:hypothetical protein TAM4_2328 [Thermococcus sp. AM4]|nr:hypothetical protein TAM4_2328 [Thermococcus sp. AM4]